MIAENISSFALIPNLAMDASDHPAFLTCHKFLTPPLILRAIVRHGCRDGAMRGHPFAVVRLIGNGGGCGGGIRWDEYAQISKYGSKVFRPATHWKARCRPQTLKRQNSCCWKA